jgi:LysR family cys regulon transcriptional activator
MTLTQLRYLCEIVRHRLHLSNAANALHTSQPGVSKQIQQLERELGCVIFKRRRNRLLSLTRSGEEIHRHAQIILLEAENIRSVGYDADPEASARLVIAATRTQARTLLPPIIQRFVRRFPNVQLEFWQGNRHDVFARVNAGDADLAIATGSGIAFDGVAMLKYGLLHHSIITQPGHPLARFSRPPLREVVKYPILTHNFEPDGRWKLAEFFEEKNLRPNIVFGAADSDVCKAYVELGLGIAILASHAYDSVKDHHLHAIRADHLFTPEPLYIGINRKRYLSSHLLELIQMITSKIGRAEIELAIGRNTA